jgi:hypothetical protein
MFQPISGHPQVHSWSLKDIEGEMYIAQVHKTLLKLLKIVKGAKLE